ncbi:MAG: J domain-containing protein [Xanthomonadaceae bacterium]|nr:J domain-containing protein [Xanthomonadaceae bacterium]
MSAALTHLGLAPGADEAAIKQAYARRLRDVRPDTDPVGFQRLNEAYRAALAQCRQRSGVAIPSRGSAPGRMAGEPGPDPSPDESAPRAPADPTHATPRAPVPGAPPSPPAPLRIDFAAFVRDFCARARDNQAEDLKVWLQERPELWSLEAKPAVGRGLLQALARTPAPVPAEGFDQMAHFFGFDDALSGIDPQQLQRLRQRCMAEWLILAENLTELTRRLYGYPSRESIAWTRRACALATQPLRQAGIARGALFPAGVRALMRLLRTISPFSPDDLPATINKAQARFWFAAQDTRSFSKPRLQVLAWRGAAAWLIAPLFALLRLLSLWTAGERANLMYTAWVSTAVALLAVVQVELIIGIVIGTRVGWPRFRSAVARSARTRRWLYGIAAAVGALAFPLARHAGASAGLLLAGPALYLALWAFLTHHRPTAVRPLLVMTLVALGCVFAAALAILAPGTSAATSPAASPLPLLVLIGIIVRATKTKTRR